MKTIKIIKTPAKRLTAGMTVYMFKKEYIVTHAVENLNGGMSVRFILNSNSHVSVYRMVVPMYYRFKVQALN